MTQKTAVYLLFLFYAFSHAQNTSVISVKTDNYTVQFLIIFNDKKEILMMRNQLGWHIPAMRSDKPQAIREAIDSLAATIGLKIRHIKLSGLYTHKFQGVKDHPEVSYRSYFTADYVNGSIVQPEDKNIEYSWISIKEAPAVFHFDFMKKQTIPILKNRKKVWGGTFLIVWEDEKLKGSEITENIYELGG
ncbi:NUDIX hydrolase [Flavobacterium limi]|nr:NUDIX hydrolase [Flavobacterium limi]